MLEKFKEVLLKKFGSLDRAKADEVDRDRDEYLKAKNRLVEDIERRIDLLDDEYKVLRWADRKRGV